MEQTKRSLLKTVTWRITASLDTFIIAWIITGDWKIGGSIAGIEVITKMIIYYFHERIWNKTGKSCKYDKNEPKNICILEPNLNMTKNCLPSIFIVEEAYRKNVDLINQCIVYCTDKVRDAKYFKCNK